MVRVRIEIFEASHRTGPTRPEEVMSTFVTPRIDDTSGDIPIETTDACGPPEKPRAIGTRTVSQRRSRYAFRKQSYSA